MHISSVCDQGKKEEEKEEAAAGDEEEEVGDYQLGIHAMAALPVGRNL